MFKRRNPMGWGEWAQEQVYPKRGFRRQVVYLWHRLRRLPDPPHRIARGVFAGTFANFPPILGIQMLTAAGLAWVMRGNIVAAVLATFLSNPLTTPFIAYVSLWLGHWMLGTNAHIDLALVYDAFADAGGDIWHNVLAIFGPGQPEWSGLIKFWHEFYLPYLIGSILPGIATSLVTYWLTIPALTAYQALRRRRLAARQLALRKKRVQERKSAAPESAKEDDGRELSP